MRIKRWFKDMFSAESFNDIDTAAIGESFNDPSVRTIWLMACFDELKRINFEVDKRLLSGSEFGLIDLCARRKAYQDMLQSIASARRVVTSQTLRPNPLIESLVDLDRVTT